MAPDRAAALLRAIAGGDREAFRQLYDETSPRLLGLALRLLRRRDAAADVVQETYVRIWQRADTYRPERGSGLGWLTTILRYRAIDRMRLREQRGETLTPELADTLPDPGASPFEGAASSEAGRRLRECLSRLDGKQQSAIVLAFVEGLTHEEIAGRIDSPVGTVKSWIRRGLKRLKDCLGHE